MRVVHHKISHRLHARLSQHCRIPYSSILCMQHLQPNLTRSALCVTAMHENPLWKQLLTIVLIHQQILASLDPGPMVKWITFRLQQKVWRHWRNQILPSKAENAYGLSRSKMRRKGQAQMLKPQDLSLLKVVSTVKNHRKFVVGRDCIRQ